jgi:arylsulfatase A-like enzyme
MIAALAIGLVRLTPVQGYPPILSGDRPNIIVVLVDDMGVMDTSVPFLTDRDGHPVRHPLNERYRTPNMEKLCERGIRFSQFYAMSVCSPSRISWMTGQNAARHRTTNWIDPDSNNAGPGGPSDWNWRGLTEGDVTLPRLLQINGYRTIHIGKGHFGPRGSEGADPVRLGFDINVGGASIGQPGSYFASQQFGATKPNARYAVPGLEAYYGTEMFLTEALTVEAVRHMDDAVREGKPFYLNFCHYAVHAPFQADPRFSSHYQQEEWPEAARAFASLVEGMDHSLGTILEHVESLGISDETLVIVLGDNGSDAPLGGAHEVACSAPLRGKKGSHYEGGMRVPMIAAWAHPNPGHPCQSRFPIARGEIQQQMAVIYDWFPTLLELAQVESPHGYPVDGRSLQRLLSGQSDPGHSERFLMHYPHAPHRSDHFTVYREGRWKLIYHYFPSTVSNGSHYQLFDLVDDPFEQTDQSLQEPARLAEMVLQMSNQLDAQSALYPEKQDHVPVRPVLPGNRSD